MGKRKAKAEAASKAGRKIELKPCPHCGNDKLFIFPPDDLKLFPRGNTYRGYVSCECGAVCMAKFYSAYPNKAREGAAAIWNRRPADELAELDEYVTQQDRYEAYELKDMTDEMMRQRGKVPASASVKR
ncbi:MAG: Lar family restriction alleviation protein [Synergistaceae bacterium]|nr:Lar family restriction alleviation protein [Synergistaceae bacterium]